MVQKIISVAIMILMVAGILVGVWDTTMASNTSVQALTSNTTATTFLKTMWPIALLAVGFGVSAGVVVWTLKTFDLI